MGFLDGFEFRTLIAPCDVEAFYGSFWNHSAMLERRGLLGFYDDLLSITDIDAVLAGNSRNENDRDLPDLDIDAALRRLEQGASLILSHAQHQVPSLALVCRTLHAELGFRCNASIEVTMPGNKPRAPGPVESHQFFLQIRGRRQWLLDTPDQSSSPEQSETPDDFITETGDLLYLPPGRISQHRTTGDDSIIASISLDVPRWVDMTGNVALADDPTLSEQLSEPLPPGWLHQPRENLLLELSRRWRQAEDMNMVEVAVSQMVGNEVRAFPLDLRGRLAAVLEPGEIDSETVFGARHDLLWVIEQTDGADRLVAGPLTIDLADDMRAAIEFCLTQKRFIASEIPGQMTAAERQVLLDRLSRTKLIRRISSGQKRDP